MSQEVSLSSEENLTPLRGRTINHQDGKSIELPEEEGFFHTATQIDKGVDIQCGKLILR